MNERRRFLVVVRCGDSSLHPSWFAAEDGERNWDLHLSYFGSVQDRYPPNVRGESISFEKGSKYFGLSDYLDAHMAEVEKYDYVAFPDDDLQFTVGNWSKVFDIIANSGASLAQPSLDRRSFFAHGLMLRRQRFAYREVDFIEVMAPVIKVDLLRELHGHFKLNQSSWGLDYVWSKLVQRAKRTMVVVDSCALLHTRRVGKGGQYGGSEMKSLYAELDETVARYNVKIWLPKALAAWTEHGKSSEPLFLINRMEHLPRVYKRMKDFMGINIVAM